MNRDFIGALLQLNAEKGVPQEILIQTLEQAIESAYRRNADAPENVVVNVDPESGEISVYREYEVVAGDAEIEDPELQMVVAEAQKIDPATGVGGKVRVPENVTQAQLGRIAAQTAGQVYRREPLTLSDAARRWLQAQPWPGNVRQLRQWVERAVLVSTHDRLDVEDFAESVEPARGEAGSDPLPPVGSMTMDEIERAMIVKSLRHHGGNVSRVAESLGLSRAALYRRFEKYEITV